MMNKTTLYLHFSASVSIFDLIDDRVDCWDGFFSIQPHGTAAF